MWSCVQTHRHKTVHGWITNDCNLTREPCIESLQSNKMCTRALYTPSILHTLHTRPGIWFTHVKGGNTHRLNVESRRQPHGPHPHTKHHIKVSTLYTTHSSTFSKQIVSHIKFDCVSSPDLLSFLYVVMCPDTQTQNRPRLNHKRLYSNKRTLYSKSAV
jgi:hypothetical protein